MQGFSAMDSSYLMLETHSEESTVKPFPSRRITCSETNNAQQKTINGKPNPFFLLAP